MRIIGEYLVVSPCLDPQTFHSQWDGCWGYRIWNPTCKWCKTIDFTIKFFISRHWSKINRISDIDMSKQWWMMMDDDGWWWMMMDDDGWWWIVYNWMKTSHERWSQSGCLPPQQWLKTSYWCPLLRCRSWPSSDFPGHSDWRWKPTGAVNSHEFHLGPSRLLMVHPHSPVILRHTMSKFGVHHKEMAHYESQPRHEISRFSI